MSGLYKKILMLSGYAAGYCLGIACLLLADISRAHLGQLTMLEEVEHELAHHPRDANLYLQRSGLYLEAGDWAGALADIHLAERYQPDGIVYDHLRAKVYYQQARQAGENTQGLLNRARGLNGAYLLQVENDGIAWILQARILSHLMKGDVALQAYDQGIEFLPSPIPEIYLERAQLAMSMDKADAAVAGLLAGCERIGCAYSLVSYGIRIERGRGRYSEAMAWVERLPASVQQSPKWQYEHALMLRDAGRQEAALQKMCEAWNSLKEKPKGRQLSKANVNLLEKIAADLNGECPLVEAL